MTLRYDTYGPMNSHQITIAFENAPGWEEVNELVHNFFVGLRLGLDNSNRVTYHEDDRSMRIITQAERSIRDELLHRATKDGWKDDDRRCTCPTCS